MKLIKILLLLLSIGSYTHIYAKAVSKQAYKVWTGRMTVTGTDQSDAPVALQNFIMIEGGIFYDLKHSTGGQLSLVHLIE